MSQAITQTERSPPPRVSPPPLLDKQSEQGQQQLGLVAELATLHYTTTLLHYTPRLD